LTKLPKTTSLRDFLYNVFRLYGKTGKTKIKNNNEKKMLSNIFVSLYLENGMKNSKDTFYHHDSISHDKA
jgi:hypothetical protein